MGLNRKLTPLIAGRQIKTVTKAESLLTLTFADGSIMRIKTGSPDPASAFDGKVIKKARQAGTELDLDFQDKTTVKILMAEASSCVMLRGAGGELQYAD